jgi:hypothetical protein
VEKENWNVSWLNNFRQNVQDKGIFDAPDATVTLMARCYTPVQLEAWVRNFGLAVLPAGVEVGFYLAGGGLNDTLLGTAQTKSPLFPGQAEMLTYTVEPGQGGAYDAYKAKILVDPQNPKFRECRDTNNETPATTPSCLE